MTTDKDRAQKAQKEVIGDCEAPETCSDEQADICGKSKQDGSLAVVGDRRGGACDGK